MGQEVVENIHRQMNEGLCKSLFAHGIDALKDIQDMSTKQGINQWTKVRLINQRMFIALLTWWIECKGIWLEWYKVWRWPTCGWWLLRMWNYASNLPTESKQRARQQAERCITIRKLQPTKAWRWRAS